MIRDSAGTVVGTSAISLDLTEKKRMIDVLIQSEKLAEIGRMGSGIVHEIKNPLTSIMMMSDIIVATKDLPEKTLKYADIIQKEAQRILRLSQNILSFARPQKPEMKATDVNRVLEDTLGLVEYELKKGKVKVRPLLDPAAPSVWGDGEKLKQVFLNLIVNATHAMPAGGELEVRTFGPGVAAPPLPGAGRGGRARRSGSRPPGPCVTIRIADHGSGIPAPIIEKIFEPFFSTKEEGKGTGLGLYISRNIVLEHRGRMEVASEVGAGTIFTIVLPTAPAGGRAAARRPRGQRPPTVRPERVSRLAGLVRGAAAGAARFAADARDLLFPPHCPGCGGASRSGSGRRHCARPAAAICRRPASRSAPAAGSPSPRPPRCSAPPAAAATTWTPWCSPHRTPAPRRSWCTVSNIGRTSRPGAFSHTLLAARVDAALPGGVRSARSRPAAPLAPRRPGFQPGRAPCPRDCPAARVAGRRRGARAARATRGRLPGSTPRSAPASCATLSRCAARSGSRAAGSSWSTTS